MAQRQPDSRPRLARRASADGVGDDHHGSITRSDGGVHFRRRPQFGDAVPRKILAHGGNQGFGVALRLHEWLHRLNNECTTAKVANRGLTWSHVESMATSVSTQAPTRVRNLVIVFSVALAVIT